MNRLIAFIFKIVLPFGIITRLHLYSNDTGTFKLNIIGLLLVGIFLYFVKFKEMIRVQKLREDKEDEENKYSVGIQSKRLFRRTIGFTIFLTSVLLLNQTIKELSISALFCLLSYFVGEVIKIYGISKKNAVMAQQSIIKKDNN